MTHDQIFAVIAKGLAVDADKINLETKASDLSEWDSLGHLSILVELELAFGASRDDDRLASATSVKDIVDAMMAE